MPSPRLTTSILSLCLLALFPAAAVVATESDAPRVLETVVVSGELPGPGLWRVHRDGHELYLLGTVHPLPKRMQWTADEVDAAVAAAAVVLLTPRVKIDVEGNFFRRLGLLPSALKARNNPDGQRLQAVLDVDTYDRWTRLKKRYLGNDRGVEKRRPLVAAQELFDAALDAEDLAGGNLAAARVRTQAKKHKVAMRQPGFTIDIPVGEAKQMLGFLREQALDDIGCLQATLDRLESDVETMKLRANAWALGEIELLSTLRTTDTQRACVDVLLESALAERHGLSDLPQRLRKAWIEAAISALDEHPRSFGLLPLRQITDADGYVAELAARGYSVEAPAPRQPLAP